MFPNNNIEDLQNLNGAVSLQNQARVVRLQDKLGKQNFHEDMKKVFEPVTNKLKKTSENITKTITETSIKNNKAIPDLNEKVLELVKHDAMIAQNLATSLVELIKSENKSQIRLRKDPNSSKLNDFLIHRNIPVTIFSNMITFRESTETSILEGDLLKVITNYTISIDHSSPQDKKLI